MFEQAKMLYLYVETPLHAGSGSSVGVIDLPIQRERVTNYPVIQASGIKGKLRVEAKEKGAADPDIEEKIQIVFGPDTNNASDHAGAISVGDARLLLFPVRSLVGVFAWTTSRTVLERFRRDKQAAGSSISWDLAALPDKGGAWTVDTNSVVAGEKVVLEEYTFSAVPHDTVGNIAKWLAEHALPQTAEYSYFQEQLKKKLVILPEDAFRDFTQFATEVITRVKIDPVKKIVARGALWTEEHLPSDTLLYAPLHATRSRIGTTLFKDTQGNPSATEILRFLAGLNLDRIQLGGDETVGRGIVKLHFGA